MYSCSTSTFYCNDLDNGVEFGTTSSGALRALISSDDSSGSSTCCSNTNKNGMCLVVADFVFNVVGNEHTKVCHVVVLCLE